MKKRFLALLMTLVMLFQITVITPYSAIAEVTDSSVSAEDQKGETDVPVLRAESGLTVLAFTSDTHNKSDNTAANRLGSWIDKVAGIYGKNPDVMAFGGDMADASASASNFWTFTQADMAQLDSRSVTGVYTTGNHEHNPGNYSSSSTNATQKAYKITAEGAEGSNYRVFCLGSVSSSENYTSQVSALTSYLNNVGNDKPIFIITHFPLHAYSSGWSRTTTGAGDVIDVLNNAVNNNGQKIVFLWGHNHTLSDSNYDEIFEPGRTITYASGSSKTIKFYYGAAGCMSDREYGSGSASVKGKGLVVTINNKNQLSFTYYDENGNNVTEGGTVTEQDPVEATAINIDPSSVSVMARKTSQLKVVFTPSDATNQGITWTSANESIATVDASGKVKGVAPGTTTITAVSKNGNVSATCSVTVTENTSTGTTYILTDSIEEGGEYLIVSSKADGSAYALRNPGATSSGATLAATQVTVSGETIETEDEDIIWTAGTRLSGFELKNDEDAILAGKGGTAYIYTLNSDPYADRYWFYDGTYLLYKGGSYTYELYYDSGFKANSFNTGNPSHPVYIYERVSAPAPVSGVTLNKSSLSVKIGRSSTLTATVLPRNAQNKSVTWTSNNTAVATVNNGVVTGVAAGTAKITVNTVEGNYTAECIVTVSDATGTTYVLTDTLVDGGEYLIANGKTGKVYIVSNEAGSSRQLKGIAAEVDDDTITIEDDIAAKAGFTVELKNSQSGAVSAWLKNDGKYLYTNSADGLRMVESTEQGSTDNTAKVWHYKGDGKDLLWYFKDTSSSDGYTDTSQTYKYYLECSNGVFTDNHVSSTSLSNTNTPAIYLFIKSEPVAGVTLDKTSLNVKVNRTGSLTATVQPSNAQNKNVTWTSSNTAVATVNNGVVTGVSVGSARITVTTVEGGYTATCNVTVSEATGTTYVLTDTLEDGREYLIANGNTGSVYIVSNEANGNRQLKGISAQVEGDSITIEDDIAAKTEFTVELKTSQSGAVSAWLKNGAQYLYTNNASGLRMVESSEQGSSDNSGKFWHYKADGKNLLWYFKDTSSSDGYTDTSGTYKYYLSVSNGTFTDNHVENSTTLANSNNLPKIYLFVKDEGTLHEHTYGEPEWVWTINGVTSTKATRAVEGVSATAVFTCTECGETLEIEADSESITKTEENGQVKYTATVKGPDGKDHKGEKVEAEKLYSITVKADKTMVSVGDEVTFTVTLSPVEHFGTVQFDLKITPENSGLTYKPNSFEVPSDLRNKLGFDTLDWTESTLLYNGMGSEADYSSTEETVLGTFKCTVNEGFTGSARVTLDHFESYSNQDWACHTPEYDIIYAEVTNHEHVAGEASYEWTGNDEDGYTNVKGSISCTICEAEIYAENVEPTFSVTTAATCTAEGAGKWTATFEDERLSEQTKNVVIPVGGHDWKFDKFTWTETESGYTAVANYKCKNDETHTETVNAVVTSEITEATCTTAGEAVYTATISVEASLDGKSYEGSKIVSIPATGHDWEFVDITWTEAEDGYTAVANYKCKNDAEHTETVDAVVTSETTDATCEGAGKIVYTATVTEDASLDGKAHEDSKTVDIPATGHDWKFVDVDWTETEDGYTAVANYECGNDKTHTTTAAMTVTGAEGEGDDAGLMVYTATVAAADSPDGKDYTATKKDAIPYTISYVLNGGTNPDDAPVTYTKVSDPVTLPIPSKDGYGFGGWYENEGLSGDAVTAIATGSVGDKTFYAKWHADACTITWKLDDSTVYTSTVESYGTAWADVAHPDDPTKEGYAFDAWTGYPETVTGDVAVTATWTVRQYTITFNSDGGSAVNSITADYGAAIEAPPAPTKEGYTFKGWDPSFPETMPAQNITVKAVWEVNQYTITWKLDSENTFTTTTEDYGTAWADVVKAEPTKSGYTLDGWDGAPDKITGDVTVTAKWKLAVSYVMSNNITFEGALTFNAYTVLTDEVLADKGAYMLITYTEAPTPASAKEVTIKVLVKDAVISTNNQGTVRRVFTNPFFIAQLHDDVTMRLYSSKGELLPLGRTVDGEIVDMTEAGVVDSPWAYLDRIIDNPNARPTMVELATKTKIYGTAAQLHFNYHTDQVSDADQIALTSAIAGTSIAEALSEYQETTIGTLPSGFKKYTKQIVFEADHSLKYFFYTDGKVDISKYTFEVEDLKKPGKFIKVTPKKVANNKYSIQRENIPSGYLSKEYRFRIKDGDKVIYEISSSGFAYANGIVTSSTNPTMVTLVKAMYLYGIAAEEHFSSN